MILKKRGLTDIEEDNSLYDDSEEEADYMNDLVSNHGEMDYYGGDGSAPMDKSQDLLKRLTEFEEYLQKLVSEWLGMIWNEDKKKYIKSKKMGQTMNIVGARWAVTQLRTYARNNNIITHLDKDTYINIMSDIIQTVYLNIGTRAEEFGIECDGDIMLVSDQLIHAATLVLVGAGGNNTYRDWMGTVTSRNESVTVGPNQNPNSSPAPKGYLARARAALWG